MRWLVGLGGAGKGKWKTEKGAEKKHTVGAGWAKPAFFVISS
ncbi:MAG: hypothetical protein AB7E72_12025 [Lysobacterales bacterium]